MISRILTDKIFKIESEQEFTSLSMEVFTYQYGENSLYRTYCDALDRTPGNVTSLQSIPFLPVTLFRNHKIVTGTGTPEIVFTSSGTTGAVPGSHYISDLSLYERSFTESFSLFYGDPADLVILALLPSYMERGASSLIYMVEKLIGMSATGRGGFYLNDYERLVADIKRFRSDSQKIVLLGVTFALLEMAENYAPDLKGITIMETGGMKGRRSEITREELHKYLTNKFGIDVIHSEYGMTELLSQAYSDGKGLFRTPPWMRIMVRDIYDPFTYMPGGATGGVNIIDLANINSCSFIETADLGLMHLDGTFEITGRFDNSDIRGCNLIVQ